MGQGEVDVWTPPVIAGVVDYLAARRVGHDTLDDLTGVPDDAVEDSF